LTFRDRVFRHQQVLLVLYATAPVHIRQQIDGLLFDEWCRMPASIDPDSSVNGPRRLAVARLHNQHLVGKALTGFVTFWTNLRDKPALSARPSQAAIQGKRTEK